MKRFLLFCLALLVLLCALWGLRHRSQLPFAAAPQRFTPAPGPKLDSKDVKVLDEMDQEYTKLVEAVVPSVVSITTSRRVDGAVDPFERLLRERFHLPAREKYQKALGSGVIISKEGHILTNTHVVKDVDEVQVQLNDGRTMQARVLGSDEDTDIAVLKIEGTNLIPLPLGDSDKVKVGQLVFAVGNPFGLQETVTRGIISAKGRNLVEGSENSFFQTDTAINPGNSGGPLVDLHGEIIAINSSIYSGSGGWQGIGFAIPANVARKTLEAVLNNSPSAAPAVRAADPRGYLGVIIQTVTPEIAQELGVEGAEGVLVTGIVPSSPAEKAGLRGGDIITNFNGHVVRSAEDLRSRVGEVAMGKEYRVNLIRETEAKNLTVGVADLPALAAGMPADADAGSAPPATPMKPATNPLEGIHVSEIPPEHRPDLPADIKGVIVDDIDEDAPAAQVLRQADVIEEINHRPVTSVPDYEAILKTLKRGEKQMLFICRGKERSFVVIDPR